MIADKLNGDALLDKQDAMLAGLDDGWNHIRAKINEIAEERGEWAGYPMPVEHCELTIEPRHPLKSLEGATLSKETAQPATEVDYEVINQWPDYNRGRDVYVLRIKSTGKSQCAVIPKHEATGRARFIMDTLAASQAWSAEAEFTAISRLKTLIKPSAFRYYLLTGTFLETSQRSRVIYLFRKCRPTIAFKACLGHDDTKLLCALCLHPIGYYKGTYAGSLVPTDDVIAHITMMRGDEKKFWGKCNQHDCRAAEAGV